VAWLALVGDKPGRLSSEYLQVLNTQKEYHFNRVFSALPFIKMNHEYKPYTASPRILNIAVTPLLPFSPILTTVILAKFVPTQPQLISDSRVDVVQTCRTEHSVVQWARLVSKMYDHASRV
jgi:hypothetical protein